MFRIVSSNSVVLPPLPKLPASFQPVPIKYQDLADVVKKHSPLTQVLPAFDSHYFAVPYESIGPAVLWTLTYLERMGVGYLQNSFDCENFERALNQTLAMMFQRAGLVAAPLTGGMSVRQNEPWAGVPAGGSHQLTLVQTVAHGPVVVEPQAKFVALAPFEEYPNRRSVFLLSGF